MRIFLLTTLTALITLTTACGSPTATVTPSGLEPQAKPVTLATYEKIKPGMTLAQVEQATGMKPKESNSSSVEVMGKTINTTTYTLANPDGSSAIFTIQDGKVTTKMQMNLK